MEKFLENSIEQVRPWLIDHGLKIVVILVVAKIVSMVLPLLVGRMIRRVIVPSRFTSVQAERKREDTLIRIFSVSLRIALWIVAVLVIASELGFALGPFLAAAGVAGLALGFGGQYLIKDLISGFFIIMENQYRIGDVVCFGGTCGLVEDISMRMTILRDLDGTVHHVPHGEIKTVSNMSKVFSRVNLDIGVSYASDLEQVIRVVDETGEALAHDPLWKDRIVAAPKFLRVDAFADSAIIIKILGDTAPLAQWDVAGELRKRIKIAFDKAGIEIPFPQRVLHHPHSSAGQE